jgi:hypothetical protein
MHAKFNINVINYSSSLLSKNTSNKPFMCRFQRKKPENGVLPWEVYHALRPQQKRIATLMKLFFVMQKLH